MYYQNHRPQLRSKAIKMHIANTEKYAMRTFADPKAYTAVRGEFTKKLPNPSYSSPHIHMPWDLKFRATGSPVHASPGVKELHLAIKGKVIYQYSGEISAYADAKAGDSSMTTEERWRHAYWRKHDDVSDEDWRRIQRYKDPMIHLDIELFCQTRGPLSPMRSTTQSKIDTDYTLNAPLSRIDVLNAAAHYSNGRRTAATADSLVDALIQTNGNLTVDLPNYLPAPVARTDTLASIIVPVVTLHIGGRSLGAHNINIDLDLEGTVFYEQS